MCLYPPDKNHALPSTEKHPHSHSYTHTHGNKREQTMQRVQ